MSGDVERIALHQFCPRCGAPGLVRHPPNLTVCDRCDLNLYHNAAVGAGAILLDTQGHVLLVRRAHEPARGKLALPGGFIDHGESLETGLRREIREETGLEAGAMEYLTSHANHYAYRGVIYVTVDVFFVVRVPDFSPARALDAVAELVVRTRSEVNEDEFAFPSLRVAWRAFCEKSP